MTVSKDIMVSIIMPTYNSEKTIELALKSIRAQSLQQELIEILVIDGGSDDATLEIAEKYGATVLLNEKRLPEYAKSIGIQNAKGKYIVENDSDEVFLHPDQLQRRIDFLIAKPEVKCILSDRHMAPKGYAFSCPYLNTVGDPFTYFAYKSKGTVTSNFRKHVCYEKDGQFIFKFQEDDILPIGDGGTTMIDMDYVHMNFEKIIKEQHFASTIFDEVAGKSGYVACIKDDNILHYSATSFMVYLQKLRFRIINNIFDVMGSGYTARTLTNRTLKRRKYLYPLYCLSTIFPLIDAIKLSIRFGDISFMMHIFYADYVLFEIVFQYGRKIFDKKTVNKAYGAD